MTPGIVPRGLRNHNPLNLRATTPRAGWRGATITLTDPSFEQFEHPLYGLRAGARILLGYQSKHGLKTIEQLIGRWAPPSENDTLNYAAFVARQCGVEPAAPYDLAHDSDFQLLLHAMIRMECGSCPYSFMTLREGIAISRLKEP